VKSWQKDQIKALISSASELKMVEPWASVALGLPHPHPLDFEWRFHPLAIATLAKYCKEMIKPTAKIALVATPTLAINVAHYFGNRPVTYIGSDTEFLAQSR